METAITSRSNGNILVLTLLEVGAQHDIACTNCNAGVGSFLFTDIRQEVVNYSCLRWVDIFLLCYADIKTTSASVIDSLLVGCYCSFDGGLSYADECQFAVYYLGYIFIARSVLHGVVGHILSANLVFDGKCRQNSCLITFIGTY